MTPRVMSTMFAALMRELGYDRFGAAGCDWGAYVTALLGLDHPDALVGIHMGMLNFRAPDYERTPEDAAFGARAKAWRSEESGYSTIQGTKPQSLAYGLTDSPAGLAGWIVEKWRRWSDCDGDVQRLFTRDELLTTIAIYWFTGTINSANRLYYESRRHPVALAAGQRVLPPAGFLARTRGRRRHPQHRPAAPVPGRGDLRRAALDGPRPRAPLPRHGDAPTSTSRSCGRSSVICGESATPHLTTCQTGAMTTATIDLLDLDRFQRLEHHAMFERLRAEDPVSWHEYPGEPGLLERRDPRGRPHREPRLRAVLVGDRRRDDHEPRGPGWLRHPRPDDALHRPAAHTRYRRLVSKGFTPRMIGMIEQYLRNRSQPDRRQRHRAAASATSSSTSRRSCRCRRSPRSWACRRRTAA